MRTTKIFPIYAPVQPKGRTYDKKTPNFLEAYGKCGVYVMFTMRGLRLTPVYVGSAKDAGTQAARHLYPYKDAKIRGEEGELYNQNGQLRTSFADSKKNTKYFVKFYLYGDSSEADSYKDKYMGKEQELIRKLAPKYNTNLKTGKPSEEAREEFTEEGEEAAERYGEYLQEYRDYLKVIGAGEQTGDAPEPTEPPF